MSNQNLSLGISSLEAVKQLFLNTFQRSLDVRFVTFELSPTTSELVITSRDESDSGEVGIYRGSYRWGYNKVPLEVVFPHALPIEATYPLTYRQLKAHFLNRFGVLLEERDLALSQGGQPLIEGTILDVPLDLTYSQLTLYATGESGRFQAGTSVSVLFLQPNTRIPLKGLLDTQHQDDLQVLVGR